MRDEYGGVVLYLVNYYDDEVNKMVEFLFNYGVDMFSRDGLGSFLFWYVLEYVNKVVC